MLGSVLSKAVAVRHQGRVALAGDGQVTHGETVVKHRAKKVQRLHNGQVLAGFAGIGRCAEGNMLRTLFSATILVGALAGPVMAHPGATQVESPGTALVGDDSRYDR